MPTATVANKQELVLSSHTSRLTATELWTSWQLRWTVRARESNAKGIYVSMFLVFADYLLILSLQI